MIGLLWTVFVIFITAWFLGWIVFHVAGALIHILLIVALILLVYNLATGRRTA
jgi:hypothetical protein